MTDDLQKKIFSRNLNRYLLKLEKTQKEVADAIEVSPQTFNTWCQGIALPRMGKIQKLADYFNIDKSDLIDDKETEGKYELTKKDLRDIKKSVDSIMESLDSHNGESLYYDGVEVQLTDENKELLRSALNIVMQAVKIENKEKYNPHKNGK